MNTYIHAHIDRDSERVTLFSSDGHMIEEFALGRLNPNILRREALQDYIDAMYGDDLDKSKIGGVIYGEQNVGAEWTRADSRLGIYQQHENGIKMHWSGTNGVRLDTTDLHDIQAVAAYQLMRLDYEQVINRLKESW